MLLKPASFPGEEEAMRVVARFGQQTEVWPDWPVTGEQEIGDDQILEMAVWRMDERQQPSDLSDLGLTIN